MSSSRPIPIIQEVSCSLGALNVAESHENYGESPNSFYSDRSDDNNFSKQKTQHRRRTSMHPSDRHFTNSRSSISVPIFNIRIVQKQVTKLNDEINTVRIQIESATTRHSSEESDRSDDSGNLERNKEEMKKELQVEEWREELKVLLYMRSKLEVHLYTWISLGEKKKRN